MQKELKNKAKFYKCDVTSQSACFELIDKIREEFGKINHLVNAVACFVSKGISAKMLNIRSKRRRTLKEIKIEKLAKEQEITETATKLAQFK